MPKRMTPDLLARAIDLQRQGWTQARIADAIGLSRQSVNKNLTRFNADLFNQISQQAAARLGHQVAALEWLVEEAALAWMASKNDAVSVKVATNGKFSDTTETTTLVHVGNPALLREVRGRVC